MERQHHNRPLSTLDRTSLNQTINQAIFSPQNAQAVNATNLALQTSLSSFLDEFAEAISGELVLFHDEAKQYQAQMKQKLDHLA